MQGIFSPWHRYPMSRSRGLTVNSEMDSVDCKNAKNPKILILLKVLMYSRKTTSNDLSNRSSSDNLDKTKRGCSKTRISQ